MGIKVSIFKPWLYKLTFVGGEKYIKLQMPFIFLPSYIIIQKTQITQLYVTKYTINIEYISGPGSATSPV